MATATYTASGLFETGTETATFDRSREGLTAAYEFVSNAFAWEIKCGAELVDECDPWEEDDYVDYGADSDHIFELRLATWSSISL